MEEDLSEAVAAEEEEELDFEFAFSIDSDPGSTPDSTADEIFLNGRIRPVYPVFNRSLIDSKEENSEEKLSSSAPANFAPMSPEKWKKSSSTGSSELVAASKKWKLRDLVVGRSRSDGNGKDRFSAVPTIEKPKLKEKKEKEKKEKKENSSSKEMDIVTAHRIYYGKVGSGGGQAGATRRSFLPYRQELLGGIFGNAKHHPF